MPVRWPGTSRAGTVAPDIRPTYLALARATAQRALPRRLGAADAEPLLELLAHRRPRVTAATTVPVVAHTRAELAPPARRLEPATSPSS